MVALTVIASFALCHAGLVALSLAMDRHYHQVWRRHASRAQRQLYRLGGVLLLLVSVICAVVVWGKSVGAVAWLGILSAVALPLIFLLPYSPRAAFGSGVLGAAIGLLAMAFVIF